jgi:hypothetical protein
VRHQQKSGQHASGVVVGPWGAGAASCCCC